MGKGDKKTARGKRIMGSYGNTRKRKKSAPVVVAKAPKANVVKDADAVEKPAAKKTAAKKTTAAKKPAAKKTTAKKEA